MNGGRKVCPSIDGYSTESELRGVKGNVEKSRQRRSRYFAVLTYFMYDPRVKMALALLEFLPASQAARVAAQLNDVPRRKVYELLK